MRNTSARAYSPAAVDESLGNVVWIANEKIYRTVEAKMRHVRWLGVYCASKYKYEKQLIIGDCLQ